MSDLISRQAAIEAFEALDWYHQNISKDMVLGANSAKHQAWYKADDVYKTIEEVPSAQPERETDWRKQGEWDMFNLITSVYFGKQYYFQEEDGIVYSRQSGKHMTMEKAVREFLDIIGE